jgi:ABC-type branched-subunit amino acid transport system permease subunit
MRDLPTIRLALNGIIIVLAVLVLPRGLIGWRMGRRAA